MEAWEVPVSGRRAQREPEVLDLSRPSAECHAGRNVEPAYEFRRFGAPFGAMEPQHRGAANPRKRLWGAFEDGIEPPSRRAHVSMPPVQLFAPTEPRPAPSFSLLPLAGPPSPGCHQPPAFSPAPVPHEHVHGRDPSQRDSWRMGGGAFGHDEPSQSGPGSGRAPVFQRLTFHPRHARERALEPMLPAHHAPYAFPDPASEPASRRPVQDDKFPRLPRDIPASQGYEGNNNTSLPQAAPRHPLPAPSQAGHSPRLHSMHLLPPPPPPPPPPRTADSWRRTRSARVNPSNPSNGNSARPAWSSMAALEPLMSMPYMVEDIMPDIDDDEDDMGAEFERLLPSMFSDLNAGFGRRRGGDDESATAPCPGGAVGQDEGEGRYGASGRDGEGRPDSEEQERREDLSLAGALRRVRERAEARSGFAMLPPSFLSSSHGMPWGMYRSSFFEERTASPGPRGRAFGGWGGFPPAAALGGGGMYGDLVAGAMRAGLPPHLLLSDRDFTPDDYELLCRLDETVENRKGATQQEIDAIPTLVVGAGPKAATAKQAAAAAGPKAASGAEAPTGSSDMPAAAQAVAASAAAPAPANSSGSEPSGGSSPCSSAPALPVAVDCVPGSGRCTICLEDWEEGSLVRQMNCTHCFHKECVDVWLKQKASCPICQRCLRESD